LPEGYPRVTHILFCHTNRKWEVLWFPSIMWVAISR
jgi:hypothetical protein